MQRPAAPSARFWPGIRLDLTDATLIDLNFTECRVTEARFDRATFQGHTAFGGATFHRAAGFTEVIFQGPPGSIGRPSNSRPGSLMSGCHGRMVNTTGRPVGQSFGRRTVLVGSGTTPKRNRPYGRG
ncbi:pentapeptide repeat-containing protein [Streptosporangium algeriense]|uniref:Pentapeptide repeat-containing protein n=1 Tax=Streptosporangium algeriense TaxID=1682748 RepID=A0ABW3DKY0_9ACTN